MFKNVYEVMAYLGTQVEDFKLIGEEIVRLGDENKQLKKDIDELIITSLGGM